MSGTKRTQASLTAEAEATVAREYEISRGFADTLARTAGLAAEAGCLAAEAGRLQGAAADSMSAGAREALAAFAEATAGLKAARQRLQDVVAEIDASRARGGGALQVAPRIAALRGRAQPLAAACESQARRVEAALVEAGGRVRRERASEQHRESVAASESRVRLEGLRGRIAARLRPDSFCSLNWVAGPARELLSRVEGLLAGSASVPAAEVAGCGARLAELESLAAGRERKADTRRAVAGRLARATEEVGYTRTEFAEPRDADAPLHMRHEVDRQKGGVSIASDVYPDGAVTWEMSSRKHGSVRREDHAHCDGDLARLKKIALDQLGLEIQAVKKLRPGGGWDEVRLPVVAGAPKRPARRKQQLRQAGE